MTRWISLVLLGIGAAASLVGPALESRFREPERVTRRYLEALTAGDSEGALRVLSPESRSELAGWVEIQLGNRYQIETLVVGRPSLASFVFDRPSVESAWVDIVANVTPRVGQVWRSTSRAMLERRDGAWYLTAPPLTRG